MRIRSIKPEFWRSDDISALSWDDRLLFIGLWSYVDDNGVGVDKLAAIAADLFANDIERDSVETFARVSRGLQELAANGRIVRYECGNKKYLYITNWYKHQRIDRPNKPRYPRPPEKNPENPGEIDAFATSSRDPRESPVPGIEEQRNRGTVKDLSSELDEFDQWYDRYPRKEAKEAARKAFTKARRKVGMETLMRGVDQYVDANKGKDRQFLAHPATWLDAGRWDDEVAKPEPNPWDPEYHRIPVDELVPNSWERSGDR